MTIREKIVLVSLAGILAFSGCGPRRSQSLPEPIENPPAIMPTSDSYLIAQQNQEEKQEKKLTWKEFYSAEINSFENASQFSMRFKYVDDAEDKVFYESPKVTMDMGYGNCVNRSLIAACGIEKLGYKPKLLALSGNPKGHMVALIEEQTESGKKYGYIDGSYVEKPKFDSIEEIVSSLNNHYNPLSSFHSPRKINLNDCHVNWRTYGGNLFPIIEPEQYKLWKKIVKRMKEIEKELEKNKEMRAKLEKMIEESDKRMLNRKY